MTNITQPSSNNSNEPTDADLKAIMGDDHTRRWWQKPTVWITIAALCLLVAGGFYWQMQKDANAQPVYVTGPVRTGNLTLTVLANRTLQPTRAVNIGSELSGTVKHEPDMAAYARRIVRFVDGVVASNERNPHPIGMKDAASDSAPLQANELQEL